jgi:hypothetical protein
MAKVILVARLSSSFSKCAVARRVLIFMVRRVLKQVVSRVLSLSLYRVSGCLRPQGRVVRRGRWSDVASRCPATLVYAPVRAREPDIKARSRVLPLLYVGVLISEISTSPC